MSSNKTFNTRVQMKHDVEANWQLATKFVPLAGEIIIYDADADNSFPRIKIGNGVTLVNNLPFTVGRYLIGSTDQITPTEVARDFIFNGKQTIIKYAHPLFGELYFTSFTYGASLETIVASGSMDLNGTYGAFSLSGNLNTNQWSFFYEGLVTESGLLAAEFITVNDIDTICGASIQVADLNEVTF